MNDELLDINTYYENINTQRRLPPPPTYEEIEIQTAQVNQVAQVAQVDETHFMSTDL